MSDDLSKHGTSDPDQINVNEEWERTYWSMAFGVTEAKLRQAVRTVGSHAETLRMYFGKKTS